jgi:hypothetical protein
MATMPQAMRQAMPQTGADDLPAQSGRQPPSQGAMQQPASPIQQLLAGWFRVSQEIGQHFPQIASMMSKVGRAVQEAQQVLISPQDAPQQAEQPLRSSY